MSPRLLFPPDDLLSPTPKVFFANHRSHLDAPVLWASLPAPLRARTRPVAAADYWSAGPFRRALATRGFNALLIERRKPTRASNPLRTLSDALERGESLILFPEGSRAPTTDPAPRPFKPGLYHLARRFPHLPFHPVYLDNLSRILPKGEFLPLPLLATARFAPPLPPPTTDEPRQHFLHRARQSLLSLSPHPHRPNPDP